MVDATASLALSRAMAICPSIDGGKRDIDCISGIEPLELLLAIPHIITAAPTKTWVWRDASGLLELP
jgi:hypothetical protein